MASSSSRLEICSRCNSCSFLHSTLLVNLKLCIPALILPEIEVWHDGFLIQFNSKVQLKFRKQPLWTLMSKLSVVFFSSFDLVLRRLSFVQFLLFWTNPTHAMLFTDSGHIKVEPIWILFFTIWLIGLVVFEPHKLVLWSFCFWQRVAKHSDSTVHVRIFEGSC